MMKLEQKIKDFNKFLFLWHKKNYRDMPWRRTSDPYKILVSEIMLQQTQVDRARNKYKEFLKAFPNVEALAHAPLGDVLRVWSGLGYNRRAKYLHLCAKEVIDKYHGKFPKTYAELAALPGIGMSTAGALLAFSFKQDTPMIDTNIRRILCRVFFEKTIPRDKELYAFAETLIPKGEGRAWNYAMLDLGASLCTARKHSPLCPLIKLHGEVEDFVYKKPQKKFTGSIRFYRGQVLKLLTKVNTLTYADVEKLLEASPYKRNEILSQLAKDGLVKISRSRVLLP